MNMKRGSPIKRKRGNIARRREAFLGVGKKMREIEKKSERTRFEKSYFARKMKIEKKIRGAASKLAALQRRNASPEEQKKAFDEWTEWQRKLIELNKENKRNRNW